MANQAQSIVNSIRQYCANSGVTYSQCYIGITKDIKERLFGAHNVYEKGDIWIYDEAYSSNEAREIEKFFLDRGMKGGGGGGDDSATFVYCYKTNPHTRQ